MSGAITLEALKALSAKLLLHAVPLPGTGFVCYAMGRELPPNGNRLGRKGQFERQGSVRGRGRVLKRRMWVGARWVTFKRYVPAGVVA